MLQGVVLVGGLGDVRLGGEGGRERGAHRGADSVVAGRCGHHGLGAGRCARTDDMPESEPNPRLLKLIKQDVQVKVVYLSPFMTTVVGC